MGLNLKGIKIFWVKICDLPIFDVVLIDDSSCGLAIGGINNVD